MKNSRALRTSRLRTGVYDKSSLDFSLICSQFLSNLGRKSGAATIFLGVARAESANGRRKVKALFMESYEAHANKALAEICSSIKMKFKLNGIYIIHALGKFLPGEPVVLVAVSAARRKAAFLALEEAVERYKKEPAIFKKEIYDHGNSKWIS